RCRPPDRRQSGSRPRGASRARRATASPTRSAGPPGGSRARRRCRPRTTTETTPCRRRERGAGPRRRRPRRGRGSGASPPSIACRASAKAAPHPGRWFRHRAPASGSGVGLRLRRRVPARAPLLRDDRRLRRWTKGPQRWASRWADALWFRRLTSAQPVLSYSRRTSAFVRGEATVSARSEDIEAATTGKGTPKTKDAMPDEWTIDGPRITDAEVLGRLRRIIEEESPLIVEHRF